MSKLLSGQRVLVVEDEMINLMMIEDMLSDLGCAEVSSAANVNKALALIQAQDFDVAMLDMNLGGAPSYPVADALAARRIPYCFATGYTTRGVAEGYGDRPVLRKPFRFEDLVKILERLLSAESAIAQS